MTPYAFAIYCDDIRREEGNKTSYMGIYGADMVVAAASPINIPKLCIAVHLIVPTDLVFKEAELSLLEEHADETRMLANARASFQSSDLELPGDVVKLVFHLVLAPYLATDSTILKAKVTLDDGQELRAGGLRIRVQVSPSIEEAEHQ